MIPDILHWFCNHYAFVVYLWGNHECYEHSIGAVRDVACALDARRSKAC